MTVSTELIQGGTHVVHFYDHDAGLARLVGDYLGTGLVAGEGAVLVATPAHREAIEAHLAGSGIDVAAVVAAGSLCSLDAEATMARFLVDHRPDVGRFEAAVGGIIRRAGRGERRVRVFGEMVAVLWEANRVTAAMELESLWNGLIARSSFSLLCAYHCASIGADAQALEHLCSLHSAVLGSSPCGERVEVEVASRRFDGEPTDSGRARNFAVEALDRIGRGAMADNVALVVAELTTNAIVHARSAFTLTISTREERVRVAVRDTSPAAPDLGRPAALEPRGRGLRLVAALSSNWGAELDGAGKVVWAELSP
ncbi:MAG: MEDS domain-containing protein [Acidimicrobiales bacterium]